MPPTSWSFLLCFQTELWAKAFIIHNIYKEAVICHATVCHFVWIINIWSFRPGSFNTITHSVWQGDLLLWIFSWFFSYKTLISIISYVFRIGLVTILPFIFPVMYDLHNIIALRNVISVMYSRAINENEGLSNEYFFFCFFKQESFIAQQKICIIFLYDFFNFTLFTFLQAWCSEAMSCGSSTVTNAWPCLWMKPTLQRTLALYNNTIMSEFLRLTFLEAIFLLIPPLLSPNERCS